MTPENSRHNAAEESRRGQEALAAARHLLTGDFYNDAITRAYYAAYHFARALLLLMGLEPRTHKGTIQLLALHYVKSGLLDADVADHLARLETDRELSDYNPAARFTKREAEARIELAEQFLAACSEILRSRGVVC